MFRSGRHLFLTTLTSLVATFFLALPGASAEEIYGVLRVHEDGSGIVRQIVREPWDIASYRAGEWVDLVVDRAERAEIEARATSVEVLREDLNASFEELRGTAEFGQYHTYAEIDAAFDSLAALYPTLVQKIDFGDSHEGRNLLALKISDNVGVSEGEPQVLFMGCHHAREVISVEMPFLFAEYLLDNYGVDPDVTALVDDREIWIAPLINPDGHQRVVNGDTFWRKNRRNNGDGTYGVDLNRNYPFAWGYDDIGSSPYTSSETYRGPSAGSEPELQAVMGLFQANAFIMALSFHSYGRVYLYPWGYIALPTADNEIFAAAGDSMAAGNGYDHGNYYSGTIYSTNGSSDDWAYGDSTKAKCFSFTPEIGDEFDTPESMIPVHFADQLPAMLFVARAAGDPYALDRPGAPLLAALPDDDDGNYLVEWTRGDGDTAIAAYELLEMTGEEFVLDSAEAGIGNWNTDTWTWNNEKFHSGQWGFYSGTGNQYTAILESKYPLGAQAGDSLVFWAWWRLEADWDYWYVEASMDGGKFWNTLPGSYTTNYNPNGNNIGNGITGSSSGNFYRMAFDLSPLAGESVKVRWRYSTDQLTYLRGVQIDDIENVRLFANADTLSSVIAGESYPVTGRTNGDYSYQVRGRDQQGTFGYWSNITGLTVNAIDTDVAAGTTFFRTALAGNAPNPFNPVTTIAYTLANDGPVEIEIVDVSGRTVRSLVRGVRSAGAHRVVWDGANDAGREVASGIYFTRMRAGGAEETKKLVLLR
ncbi:MAG: M14 family zinc carboxypeptidase [Candidatus Eisenbacteria bacterium]